MGCLNSKEWDTTNTMVREEKETLLGHYITLKRLLDKIMYHEHDSLKVLNHPYNDVHRERQASIQMHRYS